MIVFLRGRYLSEGWIAFGNKTPYGLPTRLLNSMWFAVFILGGGWYGSNNNINNNNNINQGLMFIYSTYGITVDMIIIYVVCILYCTYILGH